jgi:hypothetical protein
MPLAEASLSQHAGRMWFNRALVALLLSGLVAGLAVVARTMLTAPAKPQRQVAKISILPDTPPPPPPREEPKRPPPKDEMKQVRPQEQPKPQAAPAQDAPLKMEGAAGNGESMFSAGSVTQDYQGGPSSSGPAASTVGALSAPVSDRAAERLYANSARQLLRDEIERQLRPEAGEVTASFALWVDAEGRIRRFELAPEASERAGDLQQALDGTARTLKLPPPGTLPQPMRFRLTVRAQG